MQLAHDNDFGSLTISELMPTALDCIDAGISMEVISPPGRGKSEFFHDLIEVLTERDGFEWGYAPSFLATYTPPDLVGYQFKGERPWGPNGEMVAITEPTMPLWMMTADGLPLHHYKRGLVVLEEYGQGESDVKRASAELFLNGKIGNWRVPGFREGGWGVVALSNRFGIDRSGITKAFDFVINRRMEVHLQDDPVSWEIWAIKKGVNPLTISFAMQYPNLVWQTNAPEKQGPWCTPRSLIMSDRFMSKRAERYNGMYQIDAPTQVSVAGLLGQGAMSQYMTHIKLERDVPSLDKVVADPMGVDVPDKADMRMLVVYSFSYRVHKQNVGPILTYIERFGKDMTIAFLRSAFTRDGTLLNTPPVSAWSKKNAQLIVQISKSIV